jgi:hypothetical protein
VTDEAGVKKTPPITITLIPLPAKPGEPPVEIRVRQALKLLLRGFRLRAEWAEPTPMPDSTQTLDTSTSQEQL